MAGSSMNRFLQNITGARECLSFDSKNATVDASVVCHEVRGVELAGQERIIFSVRADAARVNGGRKKDPEGIASMGSPQHLKALELDTTVLLRVWASTEDERLRSPSSRRAVGEVRVPVERLVASCGGVLYHTWLTLENSGLRDSVASFSLLSSDDGASFDQALADAPRQLYQPKACVSICKTVDLGPGGRIFWQADANPEDIVARWGALLRSQQQHVIMSASMQLQAVQSGQGPRSSQGQDFAKAERQVQSMEDGVRGQAEELEQLRKALREADLRLESEGARLEDRDKLSHTMTARDEKERRLHAQVRALREEAASRSTRGDVTAREAESLQERQAREIAGLRSRAAFAGAQPRESDESSPEEAGRLQSEIGELRDELAKLSEEANSKIDAANERIRGLRKDRDEAARESETLRVDHRRLCQEREGLAEEKEQLVEQKEALLRIVEDLHQACAGAGLNEAGRKSVDSVTNFRFT